MIVLQRLALAFASFLVVACGGGTAATSSPQIQQPAASASAPASITSSSTACVVGLAGLTDMLKLDTTLSGAVASKDAAKIKDASDAIEQRADQILADLPPDYAQNMLLGSFGDKLKAVQAAKPTSYEATEVTTLAGITGAIAAIAKDMRESCGSF